MKTATRRKPTTTTAPASIWPIVVAPDVRTYAPGKTMLLLEDGNVYGGNPGLDHSPRPDDLPFIRQSLADMEAMANKILAEVAAVRAKFLPEG